MCTVLLASHKSEFSSYLTRDPDFDFRIAMMILIPDQVTLQSSHSGNLTLGSLLD